MNNKVTYLSKFQSTVQEFVEANNAKRHAREQWIQASRRLFFVPSLVKLFMLFLVILLPSLIFVHVGYVLGKLDVKTVIEKEIVKEIVTIPCEIPKTGAME